MTRRDDVRARMAPPARPAGAASPDHLAPAPAPLGGAPVRRPIVIPAARNAQVETWLYDHSRELGSKITATALVNTLLQLLVTDETLSRRVLAERELLLSDGRRNRGRST